MELGHFDKDFVENSEKETLLGNILVLFLLDILKTTFLIENLTQRWTQSGPFFKKSAHFFSMFKQVGEASLLPSNCAVVSAAEYASISLNMPKYPWKCLNKLFWLS